MAALYERTESGGFVPTELCASPWNADQQHGGPAAALLAGELARHAEGFHPARFSMEILRPIPMAELRVHAQIHRPGSRVRLVTGHIDADRQPVAMGAAWFVRRRPEPLPLPAEPRRDPPPPPEACPALDFDFTPWPDFFGDAVEKRLAGGAVDRPGPASVWCRLKVPILDGVEPLPWQRAIAVADSSNGISWNVPFDGWLFVNTDLTVHLHRVPEGPWVLLDAASYLEPEGVGESEAELWDRAGRLGRALQTLYVDRR